MIVTYTKIVTQISPAFQKVLEERNSRVSSGPQSDDCSVMEQIQLHEILDSSLTALALLNLFRGSPEKRKPLNRCLAAWVQRGKP